MALPLDLDRADSTGGVSASNMSSELVEHREPLAAQEGCHACKASKNELDEQILKRATQMHSILDVGDDVGIRHEYLTACNEIKYQCRTLNMVKAKTLNVTPCCHRATCCPTPFTRHVPTRRHVPPAICHPPFTSGKG